MYLANAWPEFLTLIGKAGAPDAAFARLNEMVHAAVGTKLFTASYFDVDGGQMRRVFSEDVAAYPVGGLKPIPLGIWSDTVIARQEVLVRQSIEDIAEVFFDWKLIQSLGCASIANIPVVVDGKTIGALNLLHDAGYYTEERLARVTEILPFAVMTFLLVERAAPL